MKINLFKLIRLKVYLPNCYIFYKKYEMRKINFQILNLQKNGAYTKRR